MTECDVLVVGAGPAGAASAIAVRRHAPHARVMLVDRHEFPRDKPCGDGLGPGVAAVLDELGLGDLLADRPPIDSVVVYGPHGASVSGPLPTVGTRRVAGYVCPREDFDARLVLAARDAGVELATGHRALFTELHADGRSVRFDTTVGEAEITAPLVVGADGANSVIRRALRVRPPGPRTTGIAVRAYAPFRLPADSDLRHSLVFEFSERYLPAYAWWFPGPDDVANVGLGLPVHDLRARHVDLRVMVKDLAADLRARGIDLDDPTRIRTYTLPAGVSLRRLAFRRAALVGDAAAMVNPLSGEGIYYAMAAGAMIGEAYARPGDLDDRMRRYEHAFRRRFRTHYLHNFVVQQLLRSPRWAAKAIAAADRHPEVIADAADLMFGEGRIAPRTAWRIGRSGARATVRA